MSPTNGLLPNLNLMANPLSPMSLKCFIYKLFALFKFPIWIIDVIQTWFRYHACVNLGLYIPFKFLQKICFSLPIRWPMPVSFHYHLAHHHFKSHIFLLLCQPTPSPMIDPLQYVAYLILDFMAPTLWYKPSIGTIYQRNKYVVQFSFKKNRPMGHENHENFELPTMSTTYLCIIATSML